MSAHERHTDPVDESMEWTEEDIQDWMRSGAARLDEFDPAVAAETTRPLPREFQP